MTQEQVAHAAGLTVAAYARIERGHANPMWTTVVKLMAPLRLQLVITAAAPVYVRTVHLLERGE
jgi:DNA-binding XRE family transcriptional regulator